MLVNTFYCKKFYYIVVLLFHACFYYVCNLKKESIWHLRSVSHGVDPVESGRDNRCPKYGAGNTNVDFPQFSSCYVHFVHMVMWYNAIGP